MKTKIKYFLLLGITILFSCGKNNTSEEKLNLATLIEKPQKNDTTFYYFDCVKERAVSYKSQLRKKVVRLEKLDQKYKLVKTARKYNDRSIVYKAIVKKPELCFSRQHCYKIKSLAKLKAAIHSTNYACIQGTKKLGNNKFAKADIEELVFYSEECAIDFLNYIRQIRNIAYLWDSLDQTPSTMFREENKLYFIRMRRRYMYIYPLKIREALKN